MKRDNAFIIFQLGDWIELKLYNGFGSFLIKLTKSHLLLAFVCLLAFIAKSSFECFFGARVVLEYQNSMDRYWVRQFQLSMKKSIKAEENFTSSIVACKAHCRWSQMTNASIDFGACNSRPSIILDSFSADEKLLRSTTYAKASIPCFMRLSDSIIPGANKGIFTDVFLPGGTLFGPYELQQLCSLCSFHFPIEDWKKSCLRKGFIKRADPKKEEPELSWYAWKIEIENPKNNITHFYVDGDDEIFSNWLRWVNAARFEEEQNMIPILFNESVYYYTYKDVQPGEELLVWYGQEYAKYLGISTIPDASYDKTTDFAPPKSEVVCPSCHWSAGLANISLKGTYLDHNDDQDDDNQDEDKITIQEVSA